MTGAGGRFGFFSSQSFCSGGAGAVVVIVMPSQETVFLY